MDGPTIVKSVYANCDAVVYPADRVPPPPRKPRMLTKQEICDWRGWTAAAFEQAEASVDPKFPVASTVPVRLAWTFKRKWQDAAIEDFVEQAKARIAVLAQFV